MAGSILRSRPDSRLLSSVVGRLKRRGCGYNRRDRMRIHELTPDECRGLLSVTNEARLACSRANQPYIVPVFVYFDPGSNCLYGFSTVGQKIDWMRENPKVCIEIEDVSDKNNWATVVVFGRYEEVEDTPQDADARRRAHLLFKDHPQWWFPAAGKLAADEKAPPVIYRIHIDRMSGRRANRPTV
jgi:nitroimidazol reductase NimA-like FMN-containing flavoprotein (pyridoxamine 5'-phosphate oxidase superfamily)